MQLLANVNTIDQPRSRDCSSLRGVGRRTIPSTVANMSYLPHFLILDHSPQNPKSQVLFHYCFVQVYSIEGGAEIALGMALARGCFNLSLSLLLFNVFGSLRPSLVAGSRAENHLATTTILHEFKNSTWIENLYVLPDTSILASTLSHPFLYHLESHSAQLNKTQAKILYTFPNATSTLGIAELAPYIIAVNVGTLSAATLKAMPGSFRIDILDVSARTRPRLLASHALPNAGLLNGLTFLPEAPGYLLAADSNNSFVWRLNIHSGQIDHFANPLFAKASIVSSSAINGLQVPTHPPAFSVTYLYFSNSNTNIFGRIAIALDGLPLTQDTKAQKLVDASNHSSFDDFVFAPDGSFAYIASWTADSLYRIEPSSREETVAAGFPGDERIDHPTSVRWVNADLKAVYVSTAGYFPTFGGTGGGQIVKVEF